jgi:hypothetical protein
MKRNDAVPSGWEGETAYPLVWKWLRKESPEPIENEE